MEQLKGRAWLEVRMWVVHKQWHDQNSVSILLHVCSLAAPIKPINLGCLVLAWYLWKKYSKCQYVHWGWLTNSWLSWDELGPFSLQASYLVKLLQYYQHTGNTIYHDQGFAASEVNPSIVPILSFHKWWEEPQKRDWYTLSAHVSNFHRKVVWSDTVMIVHPCMRVGVTL